MRAEMVRLKRDKIGAKPQKYVEVDETSAGDGPVAKVRVWDDEAIEIHGRAEYRDFAGSRGWRKDGGTGAAARKASHSPIVAPFYSQNMKGRITSLT